MRAVRWFFQCGVVLLLTGCATTTGNNYQQTVQSWKGANVDTLVKNWGRASRQVMNPKGNTVLAYQTERYSNNSNSDRGPAVGVNFSASGRPVITNTQSTSNSLSRGSMSLTCVALFEINPKGTIVDASTEGNGCYGNQSFAANMRNPNSTT